MAGTEIPKRRAYLLVAASTFFFLAAALGKQVAFVGIDAAFMAIGASRVSRVHDSVSRKKAAMGICPRSCRVRSLQSGAGYFRP